MTRTRRRPAEERGEVQISEARGVRLMHVGGEAIQSAIRLSAPDSLELHYTRAMMAFLLFHPEPARIVMVGLGGGSIARFVHRRMPRSRITVVEISAPVVEVARRHFGLPEDDARLAVEVADGAEWIPRHPGCADVLLLDAFDNGEHARALCSAGFYDAAFAALDRGGVMVANFMADDRRLDARMRRIERSFDSRVLMLLAEDRVNAIVLAFRDPPERFGWRALRERARAVETAFQLPAGRQLASLKAMNAHSARHLLIGAR